MSELPKIVSIEPRSDAINSFVRDLERETIWEWKWEKRHRKWSWGIHWASWASRLILLAAATYQLNIVGRGSPPLWLIAVIALFSMLNVVLPLISFTFRFPQRQEVHDRTARGYDIIRTELQCQQITLSEAVARYKAIREQPTESVVRKTP